MLWFSILCKDNTNLLFAYCQNSKIGTIRETFFANQVSQNHKLHISNKGDFTIDEKYHLEVGGKNKGFEQIKDMKDSFVAILAKVSTKKNIKVE